MYKVNYNRWTPYVGLRPYVSNNTTVQIIIICTVVFDRKDFCDAERDLLAIAKCLVKSNIDFVYWPRIVLCCGLATFLRI